MRVLIAAGGTGGHIYPGIAVAKEIMRRDAESTVRFVGTAKGLETRLVPQAGFELSLIESAGLVNMGLAARLRGLAVLPKSFLAARRLIREFRPDVAVGAGGYVFRAGLVDGGVDESADARDGVERRPRFHQPTVARFVDRAAVSLRRRFPTFAAKGSSRETRCGASSLKSGEAARRGAILAAAVWRLAGRARDQRSDGRGAPAPRAHRVTLRITHQTGKLDFAKVREGYARAGWENGTDVREYIDDMVGAFAAADLIDPRAGATTAAELMAAGKTAIMIPLPGQTEQQRNAEAMQAANAARMIPQTDLTGVTLAKEIAALIENPEEITRREAASRRLARPDAAARRGFDRRVAAGSGQQQQADRITWRYKNGPNTTGS